MSEGPGYAIFGIIFLTIFIFSAEFSGHVARTYQVSEVKQYAIELTETNGQYSSDVAAKVQAKMNSYGLTSARWSISHPTGRIAKDDSFEIKIKGSYTYRSMNILGSGIGNKTVAIESSGVGFGQVFWR